MSYSYAYKPTYRTLDLSIDIEIFNKARAVGIRQMFETINEYVPLFNYLNHQNLTKYFYLYPIENNQIKKCIFCHKTSHEVTFEKKPHVIPYLLGNQFLLHHEECDECNKFFGETLECELDKYLKPYRTLNRQKNRKGNLIKTDFSPKRSFRFDENRNQYLIELREDEIVFNHETNTVTLNLKQEKYSPLLVYKAFMKILFGLLPREHLPKFENLRKWIIDRDNNSKFLSPLSVIKTRLPGFTRTPLDVFIFHKNYSSLDEFKIKLPIKENFEYLGYIRFGNIVFETPLFSDLCFEKLKAMKESGMKLEFSFPIIPKPGFPTNKELLDFSETEKVRNKEQIYFSYDTIIENEII